MTTHSDLNFPLTVRPDPSTQKSEELLLHKKSPYYHLWAAPECRIFDEGMSGISDWAISSSPNIKRSVMWYIETNNIGNELLDSVAEVNPNKCSGRPVLKGTRFTISQVLAELADTSGPQEIADNFDLNKESIKQLLNAFSNILLKRSEG